MANNIGNPPDDAEWHAIADEGGEAEIEIYVLRKDKIAVLMQREIPHPSKYVTGLLAALLHLPKLSIVKVTIYCDGDKWP